MSTPTFTVIGAGIAGLTAAYRLKQNGYSVKILEAGSTAGGRMTQRNEHGMSYNSGARLCYSFYAEINKLIAELGLQASVVKHGNMNIVCQTDGQQYSLPLKPSLNLLKHPLLPWKEKLALIRLIPDLVFARRRINPGWMVTASDFDEQTLDDYVLEKVGPVFLEYFIEPVFRCTRSWNPEQVSPALFISTSAFMSPGSFTFSFKEGIGLLTSELARHIDIDYEAEVKEIVRSSKNNNCLIRYKVDGIEQEITSDITICAVEGSLVSDLVSNLEPAEEKFFDSIKYNSLGIVHARVKSDEKTALTFFSRGYSPDISIVEITRVNNITKLFCQMSPELSQKVKNEGKTDQLFAAIQNSLQGLYPNLQIDEGTVINQWIENKLPVFYPGYIRKIIEFHAHQEAAPRRLYFCGDYLSQALVEGACQSGKHAAETIARHWPLK